MVAINIFISSIALLIVILLKLICKFIKKNPVESASIPLTIMVGGSYAMQIATTTPSFMNRTLNVSFINSTMTNTEINDTLMKLQYSINLHFACSLLIMLVAMIICHRVMLSHIHYIHTRTRLRLRYKPLNRHVMHMPGETKLMLCFLVKINQLLSDRPIYHEVICQLCTIPGQMNAWYCEVIPSKPATFTNETI